MTRINLLEGSLTGTSDPCSGLTNIMIMYGTCTVSWVDSSSRISIDGSFQREFLGRMLELDVVRLVVLYPLAEMRHSWRLAGGKGVAEREAPRLGIQVVSCNGLVYMYYFLKTRHTI